MLDEEIVEGVYADDTTPPTGGVWTYLPGGHKSHSNASFTLEYVPGLHTSHTVCPVQKLIVPVFRS